MVITINLWVGGWEAELFVTPTDRLRIIQANEYQQEVVESREFFRRDKESLLRHREKFFDTFIDELAEAFWEGEEPHLHQPKPMTESERYIYEAKEMKRWRKSNARSENESRSVGER